MRMRPDLKIVRVPYQRTPSWVVKDPVGPQYYRFEEEEFATLQVCVECQFELHGPAAAEAMAVGAVRMQIA